MFYGIIIRMYFAPGEHNPPHFHIYYNEFKASMDLLTHEFIECNLPSRQKRLGMPGSNCITMNSWRTGILS
jgi:hypothetical protein